MELQPKLRAKDAIENLEHAHGPKVPAASPLQKVSLRRSSVQVRPVIFTGRDDRTVLAGRVWWFDAELHSTVSFTARTGKSWRPCSPGLV